MPELVTVDVDGPVALVEMHRPPHNYFTEDLLHGVASALHGLAADASVRVAVLASEGRSFCAGADLRDVSEEVLRRYYREGLSIFSARIPLIAAVQGAAVGGGFGLALCADFRVANRESRFRANFAQLGFHHGFGLTVTLPEVVGRQRALELLYTGRWVDGEEAHRIGLADRLVDGDPRDAALGWARELARSAPLAVRSIRATMRRELLGAFAAAVDLEASEQAELIGTADFAEGLAASIGKREPRFEGR